MRIRDVALKTCWRQWTIERSGESVSGISVQAARHDDDDDDLKLFNCEHLTKQLLYGHQPPITKTIQVGWTRPVGHCWRSGDKHISDVLLWTPSHGRAKAGRPARTYIQQLWADTGYSLGVMDDRDGWQERVREICAAGGTTWWWFFHTLWFFTEVWITSLFWSSGFFS